MKQALRKTENTKLTKVFFTNDVLEVAPMLLGKILCRRFHDGTIKQYLITETEAYKGEADLACHASKGRTKRTEIMYHGGGNLYVYLIYGMYWMLNIVTGNGSEPQAVLIRGIEGFNGPGKLTRELQINQSFYAEDLENSENIWICDNPKKVTYTTAPRVGIDYAGDYWKNVPWRFIIS